MKKTALFLLLLLSIFSCNPVKNKKVDQATISFQTDDSSKLFFKNVRKNYYNLEILDEAKLEIYRFKDRVLDEKTPILNLSIVNNWRYDEAYILLEPNSAIGSLVDLRIEWRDSENNHGELNFEGRNKTDQLLFAAKIYEQIQNGSKFWIKKEGQTLPILHDTKSREAFRITMFDFLRLVRSL